jgi:CHRD domain-containing protein
MKSRFPLLAAAVMAALLGSFTAAVADDRGNKEDDFAARLSGYNEVHFVAAPTPALRGAISTQARGTFKAEIDDRRQIITYELSFEGLESDVTQAHIHFGQRHTVGGIVVWLCQASARLTDPVAGPLTPECGDPAVPATLRSNTVRGMITPAQVLAQPTQGIEAGAFQEVVDAIRNGAAYANVHSATFTPGEIRGHINPNSGHGHQGH